MTVDPAAYSTWFVDSHGAGVVVVAVARLLGRWAIRCQLLNLEVVLGNSANSSIMNQF